MAMCNYYLCDVCNQKAFYDADLDGRFDHCEIAAICENCAEFFRIRVEARQPNRPVVEPTPADKETRS